MTRIVLLLTAFPLAAVLALLLDTLLDRRLAALRSPARRPAAGRGMRRVLSVVLVALGVAGVPIVAAESAPTEPDCVRIECSLVIDSAPVDRLWRRTSVQRVKLVAQSRIPVAFDVARDDGDDPDAAGEVTSGEDRAAEAPADAAPTDAAE